MASATDPQPLDLRTEIERIDRIRAEIHRQWNSPSESPPFFALFVGMAVTGATIFAAGMLFTRLVGR